MGALSTGEATNQRTTPERMQPNAAAVHRRVWFAGEWIDTPILTRDALRPGDAVTGPAIVEQFDTTTIVEPGDRAEIDQLGNLIVTLHS